MSVVIKAENISKAYQLGQIGTGTLSRDLERWVSRMRGKEDTFLKIGETNDRTKKGTSDIVWSLKDINFEIEQGEAVGIIGRNGAGKSTLLKILSRVTSPTKGLIRGKGRIASLLEVGTGFHPELTGRENIYLNGAILGMRKKEISRKFDEIVDFAGVERYIDTPVKRYSSGMYVRLAFAVAAHLESEILIVDEVLAVGDAEFQKKCLGKMNEVSKGEGKTVLFVSHNMQAIRNLCPKSLLLENGSVKICDNTEKVLDTYFFIKKKEKKGIRDYNEKNKYLNSNIFSNWYINKNDREDYIANPYGMTTFYFELDIKQKIGNVEFGLIVRDQEENIVYGCNSRDRDGKLYTFVTGKYIIKFEIKLPIRSGSYEIDIAAASDGELIDQWVSDTPLIIFSKLKDTVLDDRWTGLLRELSTFSVHSDVK